jgi:AraC-like DNA-binding protein
VKYFVDISGSMAEKLMGEAGLAPGQVMQITAPGDITHLFDELIRAGLRNTLRTPRICALVAEQLLLRMAELSVAPGAANTPAFSTYQRCREYLEAHALQLRTLGDIADGCNVDPAYLCRLFARFNDMSPYQLLLRLKMNHAAERLATSDAMIKEIAADLGYSDPFHFSRTFKRVHGIAPEQFARRRPG